MTARLGSTTKGILILALFTGILTACGGNFLSYTGQPVEAKNRVALQSGGPHSGAWDAKDLVLQYQYTNREGALQFSGKIQLVGGTANFEIVQKFGLSLYFVDAEGRIMDQTSLYRAGGHQQIRPWSFQTELRLPPGARGVAFGYSGVVRGVGPDPSTWSFWETPV